MKLLAVLCIVLPAAAWAKPMPKPIKDSYKTLLNSYKNKNFVAFKAFYAPDFESVDSKGVEQKHDEFMSGFDQSVKGATKITAKEQFLGTTIQGSKTCVRFDFQSRITTDHGASDVHEIGTDYWEEVDGKWLIVKTVDELFTLAPVDSKH